MTPPNSDSSDCSAQPVFEFTCLPRIGISFRLLQTAMAVDENTRRDPRTHDIIGAAMEVHRELGPGFLESIYQQALAIELGLRSIPFAREVQFPIHYKGQQLGGLHRADLVSHNSIVVELKALPAIGKAEAAQLVHYLKATGNRLGLLLNFGAPSLEFRRVVFVPGWRPEKSAESESTGEPPQA